MKALLLADVPPCVDYTAGIALTELCAACPPDSVVSCALMTVPDGGRISDKLPWLQVERHHLSPPYSRFNSRPLLRGIATFLHNSFIRFPNVDRLLPKVVRFAEQHKVDRIWCLLESDPVIRLAAPLKKELGLPLYTQVFDPPEWWLRAFRFDALSRSKVLRAFDDAIGLSERCATTSWNMASDYRSQYGVQAEAILPSLCPDWAVPFEPRFVPSDHLTIAIAGQLYATDAWESLLSALDQTSWVLAGRKVTVKVFGRATSSECTGRRVDYAGWHDQATLIQQLSLCDILYCPYWFDASFAKEAHQCFPSKLAAYTAAGRPVFVHAPEYASPVDFVQRTKSGVCCHSKDANTIVQCLTELVSSHAAYCAYAQKSHDAFHRHLSAKRVGEQFRAFLGLTSPAFRHSGAASTANTTSTIGRVRHS